MTVSQNLAQLKGSVNYTKLADQIIEAGIQGVESFLGLLRQLLENGFDAIQEAGISNGRINIRIKTIRGNGVLVEIEDNGTGFLEKHVVAFFSPFESSKVESDLSTIGKNGSGRLFSLKMAEGLTVTTVSKDYPDGVTFSYDMPTLVETLIEGDIKRTPQHVKLPKDWHLAKGETGSRISLMIPTESRHKVPNVRVLREDLWRFMSPMLGDMITVNSRTLIPSETANGIIIDEVVSFEGLPGMNRIFLYIPKRKRRGEELMIGAKNSICSMRSMIRQFPKSLAQLAPDSVDTTRVVGGIYMECLKPYRPHSATQLDEKFFDHEDLPIQVMRFIVEEVVPQIRKLTGEQDEEYEEKPADKVIKSLTELLGVTPTELEELIPPLGPDGPKRPPSPADPTKIKVSPASAELIKGGSDLTFKVIGPGKSLVEDLVWKQQGSGGRIIGDKKKVTEVLYRPGKKVGRFKLKVSAGDRQGEASINIVESHRLEINPRRVTLGRGQDFSFEAVGVEHTVSKDSSKLRWKITKADGSDVEEGTVVLSENRGERIGVSVTLKCELGRYILRCWDPDDPDHVAKASIKVKDLFPVEMIRVEDQVYVLAKNSLNDAPCQVRPGVICVELGGKELPYMDINSGHPLVESMEEGDLSLMSHLANAHALHLRHLQQEEARKQGDSRSVDLDDPSIFSSQVATADLWLRHRAKSKKL